ncbi:hypothetical protein E6W39_08825 [Kitasatospora acidiphila]|uniref:Small integral membrane protein n=1 Tax=Kitasatospora acidiphila TaxID=2567942 RepID=A0A540W053_9ACTN|nr:hypothetical protein [Kitasatospora acidiphila]TQF02361.1 hypothetical protein E6W39_08825 [Kitasatospora acidiphila]
MTAIRDSLWNETVGPANYSSATDSYQRAVLDQYKICVEMADRVSARRNLTNTFFLSLNSTVVAVIAGIAGDKLASTSVWLLLAGLAILLTQCLAWSATVRSYRQLNAAKYEVIGALEERLPAYAYSRAEWVALGEGHDWRKYLPLTKVEQWIPLTFAVAYLVGFLAVAA